ncbi:hypothetical protein PAPYR_11037 [Paratrimastix pyriformis]|uniref:Uncharacterized protein n=1 Tax=Paratrimastix pyriformis TaxID=342808 RepID=A0ABQ8UAF4_9EUKA|nr:hypothetical protein PAPYR_11037 [Paratrimastix pyriformis]
MSQITNAAVVGTGTGVGVYLVALWTGVAAGSSYLLIDRYLRTHIPMPVSGGAPGGGSMSLGTPFNLKVTAYNDMKQQFYFYRVRRCGCLHLKACCTCIHR